MAMTLRLTVEQDARLDAIAKTLGMSKQQAVIAVIEQFDEAASRRTKIDEIYQKVMKRDAELLERLADA
jgi:predicted transcriptional regulator